MPPQPPPLFPYTTLFRSDGLVGLGELPDAARRDGGDTDDDATFDERNTVGGAHSAGLHGRIQDQRDRKSTRLNSSHPSTSYAVFCLKKKKTRRYSGNAVG